METAPRDWEKIRALFDGALQQQPSQRPGYLERHCSDENIRKQVETLLGDLGRAGNFLSIPVLERRAALGEDHSASLAEATNLPERITHPSPPLRLLRSEHAEQSQDIERLLRRRLLNIVYISIAVNVCFDALRMARISGPLEKSTVFHVWLPAALNVLALLTIGAILSRKSPYNLGRLRWIEVATFGITTLYLLGDTYFALFGYSGGWLITYSQRHIGEMSILARQPSILWMAVIIGYGTFIPNTGRRCALISGTIAISPLILIATAGLLHPDIPKRYLVIFLAEMAMWMGCAVAMAIYGSHKITVLREQALEARKLGQYVLRHLVGKGGMGEVYLAEHVLLKRPCAIKVIRPDQTKDPEMLQRFLREVQVTATLTHPNTIQVFDYGQADDGTVFYVMEYLSGLNLEEMVTAHGAIPPQRAIHVLRQVCGALTEAHTIGLIHRDIKPSNIFLCRRSGQYDIAKLLDFGLVRTTAAQMGECGKTQPGTMVGTPTYIAPEQALGNAPVDARSDIYSLGAVAYFLLTAQPPFVRNSMVETLAAHINEPACSLRSFLPSLPQDLDELVLRCLEKDPARRFADVGSLDRALANCTLAGSWTDREAATWWNSGTNATLQAVNSEPSSQNLSL